MDRQEILNLLDWTMRQNRKRNTIKFNKNESKEHLTVKFQECLKLHLEGKEFYTEAVFKGGLGRADIFTWDENGECEAIEIVHTEDITKSGKEKYPCPVRFVRVKL